MVTAEKSRRKRQLTQNRRDRNEYPIVLIGCNFGGSADDPQEPQQIMITACAFQIPSFLLFCTHHYTRFQAKCKKNL